MKRIPALHSWIDNLPPAIREAVVQRMHPRQYRDGEAVYILGEEGHELYRVESGKVRSCNYTSSGREIQYIVFQARDCFGELSLIDGLCRIHSTYAQGPTELLVLNKRDFDSLCAEYPEITAELNKLLSRRLRVAHTIVDDATVLSMKERLARLLARLGYSVGEIDEQEMTVLEGFTHENLARMMGTTREGISRDLKHLEELGLIRRSYGKILIPDIKAMIDSCDDLVGGEPIVPDYRQ